MKMEMISPQLLIRSVSQNIVHMILLTFSVSLQLILMS